MEATVSTAFIYAILGGVLSVFSLIYYQKTKDPEFKRKPIYYAGIFSCIGIIIKKIKPGNLIPFAPFMALGGISVWIMGYEFWNKILFYSIS